MSNPLQPKVIKCLEEEYGAYVINITSASKSGHMDLIACIPIAAHDSYVTKYGLFYGFEIKYKNDVPSELQKQKINALRDAKGRGYFIRSIKQLKDILDNNLPSEYYELKPTVEI